jgi:ubiquinone/menaquinone biosynthesis C-methylase UbiE
MHRDRDVAPFHRRAPHYEHGWRGKLHRDIATRTANIALACAPEACRVLDVGCGTGFLLRHLAHALPEAADFIGIDAAAGMIESARSRAADPRLRFLHTVAEQMPFPDGSFDLVVSTTSFDHWNDQQAGLSECARVLTLRGTLVLTDLFSLWLVPTLYVGHRGHARTKREAEHLLHTVGFVSETWHRPYTLVLATAVATR